MDVKMQVATLLAKQIREFIEMVHGYNMDSNSLIVNKDKVYQVRLFIEEYKFGVLADELQRINQYCWNETYTYLLAEDFRKGKSVIDEYVSRNYEDLFLLSGRLHTLENLSVLLTQ